MKSLAWLVAATLVGAISQDADAACTSAERTRLRASGVSEAQVTRVCGPRRAPSVVPVTGGMTIPAPPAPSNLCQTPRLQCALSQRGPVGTPCWCTTSWGPVNGRLIGR
jgi:hypothetical protein